MQAKTNLYTYKMSEHTTASKKDPIIMFCRFIQSTLTHIQIYVERFLFCVPSRRGYCHEEKYISLCYNWIDCLTLAERVHFPLK